MSHLDSEKITDFAHHALDDEQDALVFGHIQRCDECREQYELELGIIEVLQAKAGSEEREFPESLRLAILSATGSPKRLSILQQLRGPLRPALLSFTAAAAAVALMVTPHLHGASQSATSTPSAQTLTAMAFFSQHDAATLETPLADHAAAPSIETAAFVSDDANDSSGSPD